MNPNTAKIQGDNACWCCEGTGKAFNAIDMEWSTCLYCGGTGEGEAEAMGEAKRKRLHSVGPTELRPKVDIDVAIEEFERLVEADRIEGFLQIAKCQPAGARARLPISELKLFTYGLEKRDAYDMLCILKRSMEETTGFKEGDAS